MLPVQKARLPASSSASKLAVPKPVNLPSLRKVRWRSAC